MRPVGRTFLRELPWMPFAVAVWILALAWMLILPLVVLPLLIFTRFEKIQHIWPQPQIGWTLRLTLSRIRIEYDPAFDPRRVSVFIHNHTSMLDAHVACAAIPQPFCGLENAAHLNVPGYGWLMRLANAIPVHPRRSSSYNEIAEACKERASRGISVLTFPEGHRTLDGKLRSFRRGSFFMARDAGIPIVPIAVRGLYGVLPKGTWVFIPGRIDVYVGPQIELEGRSDEEVEALVEQVRRTMIGFVEHGDDRVHWPPRADSASA
jgi:1-acyl-sn-glycerol-3-phosphate acyltransferase